jgi:hypothetical protein
VPSVLSDLNNENNNLVIKNKIKNEKNELIDVITNYNNSSRNIVFIEDRTNTINMD